MTATAYRASAPLASYTTAGAAKNQTIPASVVAGDIIFLAMSSGTNGQASAAPSGWTAVPGATGITNGVVCDLFYRIAQSGDAGSTVTIAQGTGTRAIVGVSAYSGVNTAAPFAVTPVVASETVAGNSHTAAAVTVPSGGGMVVRFFYMKDSASAASTVITPPAGFTTRQSQPGVTFSGTAQISLTIADSNGDLPAGSSSGTWTHDGGATATAVGIGIALAPLSSTVSVRPVADITTAGVTIVGGTTGYGVTADDDPGTYLEFPAGTNSPEEKVGTLTNAPTTVTVGYYVAGGAVAASFTTKLMMGATTIATWGPETGLPTGETFKTYTLTAAQQTACTNLADLRVRTTGTVS